jgi:hypothetical protein
LRDAQQITTLKTLLTGLAIVAIMSVKPVRMRSPSALPANLDTT